MLHLFLLKQQKETTSYILLLSLYRSHSKEATKRNYKLTTSASCALSDTPEATKRNYKEEALTKLRDTIINIEATKRNYKVGYSGYRGYRAMCEATKRNYKGNKYLALG